MKKLLDYVIIKRKPIDKEEIEESYFVQDKKSKKIYGMFKYNFEATHYIDKKCMKSCPYCKTKNIEIYKKNIVAGHGEAFDRWEIYCAECKGIIFSAPASNFYNDEAITKQEAITKYNKRNKK